MSWHYLVSALGVFILWLILEFAFQGTSKLLETIGWWWIGFSLLLVFFGGRWMKRNGVEKRRKLSEEERKKRFDDLIEKYGDQDIVERILRGEVWVGQSGEQVTDALGQPEEVGNRIESSRGESEVWKYGRTSAKRFSLHVTLKDGFVSTIKDNR